MPDPYTIVKLPSPPIMPILLMMPMLPILPTATNVGVRPCLTRILSGGSGGSLCHRFAVTRNMGDCRGCRQHPRHGRIIAKLIKKLYQ